MANIHSLNSKLDRKLGELGLLSKQLVAEESSLKLSKKKQANVEKANTIINDVALQTQGELSYHISDIVSMCLAAIFTDPYKFSVEFEIKRGKTECKLMLERDGELLHPFSASGGGVVDIASFGLRIALFMLANPRPASILILDEPFKFLSVDLHAKASEMLKMISRKIGIQIIMVSHSEELIESADNTFRIGMKGSVSHVTDI